MCDIFYITKTYEKLADNPLIVIQYIIIMRKFRLRIPQTQALMPYLFVNTMDISGKPSIKTKVHYHPNFLNYKLKQTDPNLMGCNKNS